MVIERREIDLMLCVFKEPLILQLPNIPSLKNVSITEALFTCCQDITARILHVLKKRVTPARIALN